ncbi:MAG: LytR C-terminal domain-containing protein [Gemmatimonadaceae bacterium]|nr:LytR C-terminal domain-containing protein [Gemmatimonadaceae bacterium]
MSRARLTAVVVLLVVIAAAGVVGARRWYGTGAMAVLGDTTRAPDGARIVVEVLNASGVTGLAKRATFLLRDRGFDVVGWANDPAGRRGETLIVDYTNRPEAAERLARVLGGASIERGKDSLSRGLDLHGQARQRLPAAG